MILKCILILSCLSVLDAQLRLSRTQKSICPIPRLAHGKVRSRGGRSERSRFIKFNCVSGYELVGSRYSICQSDGTWDATLPVCVKPGCSPPPPLENGISVPSRYKSWIVYFCLAGFRLVGSQSIYCDGTKWNATAPVCFDSTAPVKLSCDFETPDLCGWTHDTYHDFDWTRLNKKTPSSYLNTGPSYDHTYGEGGSGYYMYIESSSRLENDTARLLSPVYNWSMVEDGCFSFYYHMFGKSIGGLRVYQKPVSMDLVLMLSLEEVEKQKYLLFEQWGNRGDVWWGYVASLKNFSDDFQIVIEGIRGSRFSSDIAIDDVAILQGDKCVQAKLEVPTTPAFLPESCDSRCGNVTTVGCGCYLQCIIEGDCCPDYLETCVYGAGSDYQPEDSSNATVELPQTQKLVAKSTPILLSSTPLAKVTKMATPMTTLSTTTISTTSTTTTTTTAKPPIKIKVTLPSTTSTPVPTPLPKPKQPKVTIFQKDAIKDTQKDETVIKSPVKPKTMAVTTKKATEISKQTTNKLPKVTKVSVVKLTTVATATKATTKALRRPIIASEKSKVFMKQNEQFMTKKHSSSMWKPVLITLAVLLCGVGLVGLMLGMRGARGRAALDYVRGRARHDPEVRYLNCSDDDN